MKAATAGAGKRPRRALTRRKSATALAAALTLWCIPAPGIEGVLVQVQRELRARKYYFGPVDGRASSETTKAIEEFQRAKALDANGEPDEETLRALGLKTDLNSPESQALKIGRGWLARYWHACESGDWPSEERFYASTVRYYSEGEVSRDHVREQRTKFYGLWPIRKQTPLLCYASWNPRRHDELWVSARIRNAMKNRDGVEKVHTEELLFVLRQGGGEWRLTEIREWPLVPSKKLP